MHNAHIEDESPLSGAMCALSLNENGTTGTITAYKKISVKTANEMVTRIKAFELRNSRNRGLVIVRVV
jgi:hypothetical protein